MANNYKKGVFDTRPWGSWEVLDCGTNFCVKKIIVNPKSALSLQSHNHRNEHWIIVEGEAITTIGEQEFSKKAGDSIFIPTQTKHRIRNEQNTSLTFIEVQYGDILDEEDIIRYEDIYGRA